MTLLLSVPAVASMVYIDAFENKFVFLTEKNIQNFYFIGKLKKGGRDTILYTYVFIKFIRYWLGGDGFRGRDFLCNSPSWSQTQRDCLPQLPKYWV